MFFNAFSSKMAIQNDPRSLQDGSEIVLERFLFLLICRFGLTKFRIGFDAVLGAQMTPMGCRKVRRFGPWSRQRWSWGCLGSVLFACLGSVFLRTCGQFWRIVGSLSTNFWLLLGPRSSFFMWVGKVGVQVGVQCQNLQKLGSLSPKEPTFAGGIFGSLFWSFFGRTFERACLATLGPKGSQRRPQVSLLRVSFGHCLGPSGKLKIELSLQSELNIWGSRGPQTWLFLVLFSSPVRRPPPEASQIILFKIYVNFGRHLGSIWGSFLAHLLWLSKSEFSVPFGLVTNPRFCSLGSLKDLLS